MTTASNPKNQNDNTHTARGSVQINGTPIPIQYFKAILMAGYGEKEIRTTYYGNDKHPNEAPDDNAQITISEKGWNVGLYMKPAELRELAAVLCQAAATIEEGQRAFDEGQRINFKKEF